MLSNDQVQKAHSFAKMGPIEPDQISQIANF